VELTISPPRAELLAAAAVVYAEQGYVAMDVEQIASHAGLTRTTFFEYFDGKAECLAALQEEAREALRLRLSASCDVSAEDWPQRVCAAVAVLLDFASTEPHLLAVLLPNSQLVEPALAERVWETNDYLVEALREGRSESLQLSEPPEEIEQVLVGGVGGLVGTRIRAGRASELPTMREAITQTLLMPYLGPELARRVAQRDPGADR
jgi:AcrR family transcriptional regulator